MTYCHLAVTREEKQSMNDHGHSCISVAVYKEGQESAVYAELSRLAARLTNLAAGQTDAQYLKALDDVAAAMHLTRAQTVAYKAQP